MSNKKDVVIIDYGLGNLLSVKRAILAAGGNPIITSDPSDLLKSKKLILPGVGAFAAGMDGLKKRGLIEPLIEVVNRKTYLLGICLGMQLLMNISEEFGRHDGLCLIDGEVKLLIPKKNDDNYKIPHIGWNSLIKPKGVEWRNTLLESLNDNDMAYFVHSYAVYPKDKNNCLSETEYGGEVFCSTIFRDNIYGVQFHPEKSGDVGQEIIRSFLNK